MIISYNRLTDNGQQILVLVCYLIAKIVWYGPYGTFFFYPTANIFIFIYTNPMLPPGV